MSERESENLNKPSPALEGDVAPVKTTIQQPTFKRTFSSAPTADDALIVQPADISVGNQEGGNDQGGGGSSSDQGGSGSSEKK